MDGRWISTNARLSDGLFDRLSMALCARTKLPPPFYRSVIPATAASTMTKRSVSLRKTASFETSFRAHRQTVIGWLLAGPSTIIIAQPREQRSTRLLIP